MPARADGILIFGANGSGKTTLARAVAAELGCACLDAEDFWFAPADDPYAAPRTAAEAAALLRETLARCGPFVLSAVRPDGGAALTSRLRLAVLLDAPAPVRERRILRQTEERFGARAAPGGDLYEREKRFRETMAARDYSFLEEHAQALPCPVLRLDGTASAADNARTAAARYRALAPERSM